MVDITNLANDYLPKSAIDRTTIRMAELLQHRMGAAMPTNAASVDKPDSSKDIAIPSPIITK